MSDIKNNLRAIDLWHDDRQEEGPDGFLFNQDEATQKIYRDHAESLDLYKKSGGVV